MQAGTHYSPPQRSEINASPNCSPEYQNLRLEIPMCAVTCVGFSSYHGHKNRPRLEAGVGKKIMRIFGVVIETSFNFVFAEIIMYSVKKKTKNTAYSAHGFSTSGLQIAPKFFGGKVVFQSVAECN